MEIYSKIFVRVALFSAVFKELRTGRKGYKKEKDRWNRERHERTPNARKRSQSSVCS